MLDSSLLLLELTGIGVGLSCSFLKLGSEFKLTTVLAPDKAVPLNL